MKIFKQKLSKKTKIHLALVITIVIALGGYIFWDVYFGGPLTRFYQNRDHILETIRNFGPLAPFTYILLQILQTVIAPIPGNVVGGIGGAVFGWWGILWTSIGATLGATGVFYISRRFGRTLVEKTIKKSALDKFDFVLGRRAPLILFLIFLIPGLPDDIVCYVAGLTEVPIKKLIAIFFIGRLPAVIVNNYIGMNLGEGNLALVAVISVIAVILLLIAYSQQDRIYKFLSKSSKDN